MFFSYAASATAVTTSLAVANAGHFIGKYTEFTPLMSRSVTVAIIVVFTLVNCIGVRESGKTQNILTLLKVGGILTVITACFFLGRGHPGAYSPLLPPDKSVGEASGAFGTAMILTVFSYSGWYFITHVAGEVREPEKNLPRAIYGGMGILILLYVAVNAAYIYVLPFETLRSSPRVAASAMDAVFGPIGADIISAIAFLSAIGAVNAQLLNYPRIPFSLASDGVFFKALATVHPTRRTPVNAIAVFALIACAFAISGTYQDNLTYVGFVGQLFMALTVVGLIVLRKREPNLPRPFKVPLYPFVPLLYIAILTWYLGNLLVNRFLYSLVGIAVVIAGLPFYWYWTRRNALAARAMSVFMPGFLAGKNAFVAGGTSGINLDIALALAEFGANVAVLSRKAERVAAAVTQLGAFGVKATGSAGDVRDFAAVEAAMTNARDTIGAIDIVVSGAAGNFLCPADELTPNGFRTVVEIDLIGTFHVMRAAHAVLRTPGASLINISAPQSTEAYWGQSHASAAKAGVDMLTRSLAVEWGPSGTRVNAIIPGPILGTEGVARLAPTDEIKAAWTRTNPLRRFGSGRDVAQVALFLCSDAAAYVNGAIIYCDGGQVLGGARDYREGLLAARAAKAGT